MVDVDAQDALELRAADDQEPVEAVPANGADPALGKGVRLRRPERSADDLDAFAPEDGVEGAAELAITIVDQEPRRHRSLAERPGKLPRLLNGPTAIRVRSAAGEVNAARAKLKKEEHVDPAEPKRLDREKVASNHRRGVRTDEHAPTELDARAGRWHAGLPQDLGDARRRNANTDTGKLADDPLIAPPRILTRKPQHQLTNLLRDRRPARPPPRVRPPFPHKLAMPTKQRVRANEERRQIGRAHV